MNKPHVVIVGAGFGGVYTALKLAPFVKKGWINVTLINKTNYFLFTPLLHEVATGGLGAHSATESLREIFSGTGVRLIQATVDTVDMSARKVIYAGKELAFDVAVVATGAETNYYNIPGAKEYTRVLKNLSDALSIREELIDTFEDASCVESSEERKKHLTFVVVGGGATGVEMAAEIAEFIDHMYERHFKGVSCIKKDEISLHLVNTGPDLLSMLPQTLREKTARHLQRLGVMLHLGATVTEVHDKNIMFKDGSSISARFILWAAGVTPVAPVFLGTEIPLVNGRISTDPSLQVVGTQGVFALGDVSLVQTPDTKGYPPVAQVAAQQANVVASNIIAYIKGKPLKQFTYQSKGTLVSLGQWYAVGTMFGMSFSGKLMWWIWRTVYLFKFNSWSKRWRIMSEWSEALFFPRDITKLR